MLDFDGVLADLQGAMVEAANDKFDLRLTTDMITDWHWWRTQPRNIGSFVWGDSCFQNGKWTEFLNPYPQVPEAIALLKERGIDPVIVSDRPRKHRDWIEAWAKRWGVWPLTIIATNHEFTKAAHCRMQDLVVAIEDNASNARQIADETKTDSYLVRRPWNAREIVPKNVGTADSLWAVIEGRGMV